MLSNMSDSRALLPPRVLAVWPCARACGREASPHAPRAESAASPLHIQPLRPRPGTLLHDHNLNFPMCSAARVQHAHAVSECVCALRYPKGQTVARGKKPMDKASAATDNQVLNIVRWT